jgi:hypothetical protein
MSISAVTSGSTNPSETGFQPKNFVNNGYNSSNCPLQRCFRNCFDTGDARDQEICIDKLKAQVDQLLTRLNTCNHQLLGQRVEMDNLIEIINRQGLKINAFHLGQVCNRDESESGLTLEEFLGEPVGAFPSHFNIATQGSIPELAEARSPSVYSHFLDAASERSVCEADENLDEVYDELPYTTEASPDTPRGEAGEEEEDWEGNISEVEEVEEYVEAMGARELEEGEEDDDESFFPETDDEGSSMKGLGEISPNGENNWGFEIVDPTTQ